MVVTWLAYIPDGSRTAPIIITIHCALASFELAKKNIVTKTIERYGNTWFCNCHSNKTKPGNNNRNKISP